jgi:hypothetical protein
MTRSNWRRIASTCIATGETDYQYMVTVLDVIQQLDITKVGLATEAAPTRHSDRAS